MNNFPLLASLVVLIAVLEFIGVSLGWIGFIVAAYSTMANDSIQTLGTFLSSHAKMKWWLLWLIFGCLMVITLSYGWYTNHHQLDFNRLNQIPEPGAITYMMVLAPTVLLVLTYMKIPVSTTFLILSMFSSNYVIDQMLVKSCLGYILAFVCALLFWKAAELILKKWNLENYNHRFWQGLQWVATGLLWMFWLMHDTANIVVFLPRQFSFLQMLTILAFLLILFGIIMYQRGTGIQEIVSQKKDSQDIRAATLIDLVFAAVLIFFKYVNNLPMSTTWVFLGVLAGRELMLRRDRTAGRMIISDIGKASIGIVISLFMVSLSRI